MSAETYSTFTDDVIRERIANDQAELGRRAEKRRQDAMEEIYRRAREVGLHVTVNGRKPVKKGAALTPGARYVNPDEPKQFYVVGNGRPPAWFARRRSKGTLPAPANDNAAPSPAANNNVSAATAAGRQHATPKSA